MEFHGASFWSGKIANVWVSGAFDAPNAYILFDGLQLGGSQNENMYLDQQNETVICAANCYLKDANNAKNTGGDGDAAITIGPDATSTATGVSPIVLQLDQGTFDEFQVRHNGGSDIYFETDVANNNKTCNCVVALGGGIVDVNTRQNSSQPGAPTTNDTTRLTDQTTYAPPTFGNAATVGAPLTLNPNELGIGVSTDTEGPPGLGGLKLRVECSSPHTHDVKIVALAGTSGTETVIADGIGGGTISACQ
jgi:hypothetical protein